MPAVPSRLPRTSTWCSRVLLRSGIALRGLAVALLMVLGVASALLPSVARSAPPERLWCTGESVWIYAGPRRDDKPLGALLRGDSVLLRSAKPVAGPGCAGRYHEVEPAGFVCDDGLVETDAGSRAVRAVSEMRRRNGAFPFEFAISDYAPMYRRLPTGSESARIEGPLGPAGTPRRLHPGHRGHERLAWRGEIKPEGSAPWFLEDGGSLRSRAEVDVLKKFAPAGSTVAYVRAFDSDGRRWLLGSEGTIIPADRVRPFRRSEFRGILLQGTNELPVAWTRRGEAKRWRRDGDGFSDAGTAWPVRRAVALDPSLRPVTWNKDVYLRTRECSPSGDCAWILQRDATVVEPLTKFWWKAGEQDRSIVVSITRGTLVAYEGRRPVYATLMSPGEGGVPRPGVDPVKASTTPLGVYRVTFKLRHTTMSPEEGDPKDFWMGEVPHTQYFNMPFALHAAYWHEDFGLPMSAGCINVSPIDAEWLFEWTLPHVPDAWGGATTGKQNGLGSFVVVTR